MRELSILLVEDEKMIREELAFFLQHLAPGGLFVASDGETGLELYREHHPDVVITDLEMPGKCGMEMIEEIRAIDPTQAVIVSTAHSDTGFLLKAIELQIDHYLLKPINLAMLEQKIAQIRRRLELEEELRQKKQILEEIANLEGNMVIVLDETLTPIFLNQGYLSYFGVASLEAYQKGGYQFCDFIQLQEETFIPECREGFAWVRELEREALGRRMIALQGSRKDEATFYNVFITRIDETGHTIVALSEITELAMRKNFYRRQARIDELTGLYNRFVFNQELTKRIDRARNLGKELCLILFDLDHFKKINDQYGHMVGDQMLVEVARLLREVEGPEDFLGRWGGEEFVIMTSRGREETRALAE
uniref:sensor domain-containing diguanylate cyclase n=1 Tax=Nitratifractor sp. TaxID=2268144 RepID=UPI0025E9F87F